MICCIFVATVVIYCRFMVGMAKRKCNDHAKWLAPDFSDCVSDEYTNLNENVSTCILTIQSGLPMVVLYSNNIQRSLDMLRVSDSCPYRIMLDKRMEKFR